MKHVWLKIIAVGVLLTAVLFAAGIGLASEGGSCGDAVRWILDDEGILTVSGTGEMTSHPWTPGAVKRAVIEEGVTGIVPSAFWYCTNMTEISIPDSVNTIGSSAFYNCSQLTSIRVPEGITVLEEGVFRSCPFLSDVILPSSLRIIHKNNFRDCGALRELTVPDGVNDIASWAFYGSSIEVYYASAGSDAAIALGKAHYSFRVPGSGYSVRYQFTNEEISGLELTKLDKSLDLDTFAIPDGVTVLSGSLFYQRTDLTRLEIPEGIVRIDGNCFDGCTGLTGISLPKTLVTIGDNAFRGCTGLTEISIPDGVTEIGKYAFSNCTGLTSFRFPAECGIIEDHALYGCTGLTEVLIPEGITAIGAAAFGNCAGLTEIPLPSSVSSIGNQAFWNCTGLTSFDVPETVTSLGSGVFSACASLTRVTLPAGTAAIGNSLFSSCGSLKDFIIPESVTAIGASAFSGCSGLTALSIPASVRQVGESAFSGCKGLSSIHFPDSVTELGVRVLYGCDRLTNVRLPAGLSAIPEGFFCRCVGLTEVEIPETITVINREAFMYCTGLTRVNLPSGLTRIESSAFWECKALAELELPDTLTILGPDVFYKCAGLSELRIPDGLSVVDYGTFYDCPAVRYANPGTVGAKAICRAGYSFQVPGSGVFVLYTFTSGQTEPVGLKVTGVDTEVGAVVIPDGVTEIPDRVFSDCGHLTGITLPDTVTSIGELAFAGCTAVIWANPASETAQILSRAGYAFRAPGTVYDLKYYWTEGGNTGLELCAAADQSMTDAEIPAGVTRVGSAAFRGFKSLKRVVLPDSVAEIGSKAFQSCEALEEINLPENVEAIGEAAFGGCAALTEMVIPERVSKLEAMVFSGCTGLTRVVIPEHVTRIGAYAFSNCSALTGLTLPSKLTEISQGMLNGCTALTELTVPDGITGIGAYAFQQCAALKEIRIPDGVSSIGSKAFEGCGAVFSAIIGTDGARTLGTAGYSFHIPEGQYVLQYHGDELWLLSVDTGITGTLSLPEGITVIGEKAFNNCVRITDLVLPESLKTICAYAFNGMTLDRLQMPDGITDFKLYYNYGCDADYYVHMNSLTAQNFTFTLREFIDPDYPGVYLKRSGESFVPQRLIPGCAELDLRFLGSPSDVPSGLLNGEKPSVVRLPDEWMEVPPALAGLKASATFVTAYGSGLYQALAGGNYKYALKPFSPESISAQPLTIFFGKREKLRLSLEPAGLDWTKFEVPEFTFTSSDPTVVSVSQTGELRGLSAGTATVWVQDRNDPFVNATVPVTVTSSNTDGKLFAFANLSQGASSVTASYGGQGGVQPYTVAFHTTLDGVVTDSGGTTDLTSEENRVTQTLTQEISSSVYKFTLTVKVTDAEGNSATAQAYCTREYKIIQKIGVGTPTVAMVQDEYGNLGYQYVYPSYEYVYGYVNTCVNDDPTAKLLTALSLQDLPLLVGNSGTIRYGSSPGFVSATDLVWSSSDPTIADVDEYGLVTAFRAGRVVITAFSTDGSAIRGQCTVTVAERLVESVTLTAGEVDPESRTQQITALVLPENATYPEIRWSSSDSAIARVDENGTVTWFTAGSVTVTASAADGSGVRGTIQLSWDGILMEKLTLLRDPENSMRILWQVEPENATNPNVIFATDNPQILGIDAAGNLTYVSEGTATVQAKARDKSGLVARLEIYVHFDHTPTEDVGVAPTCTEAGYRGGTHCAECGILLRKAEVIPPLGHRWGGPVYTWNEGLSQVTAVRVCERDESHVESETVPLESQEIVAPSCLKPEQVIYRSCDFESTGFRSQILIREGEPALGHIWEEPVYTWSDDNSSVTAIRQCKRDTKHIEAETVHVRSEITKAPDFTSRGETTYTTEAFENPAFTVQAKTLADLPTLEYNWGEPTYEWNDDNSRVTAMRISGTDPDVRQSETVKVHRYIETHPGPEEEGSWRFVSEAFENEAFTIQEKHGSLPALNEMETLTLPAGLTEIGDEAFAGFGGEAVLIPGGVALIGQRAFADCPNLLYVQIPAGTQVAPEAFMGSPMAAWEQ